MKGMLRDRRGRRLLRLLHRNGGVVLSLFLALFAISGVLLNHTEDIGLDQVSVPALVASRYYEIEPIDGFAVEDEIFYELGDSLFMNRNAVDICAAVLGGATRLGKEYVVLCGDTLVLLAEDGSLVERLGVGHGVPVGATAIAAVDGDLFLQLDGQVVAFDLANLTSTPVDRPVVFEPPVEVPMETLMTESLSWEQFILDLHSGQFLGKGGVWLADFIALLLVLLGISGILMFVQSGRH